MSCKNNYGDLMSGVSFFDAIKNIRQTAKETPSSKIQPQIIMPNVGRPVRVTKTIPRNFEYPVFVDLTVLRYNAQQIAIALNRIYQGQDIQLVARGTSGLLIAAEVQRNLESAGFFTSIYFVRKPGENSHGGNSSFRRDAKLIVVDDHISSGTTMRAIANELRIYDRQDQVDAVVAFHSEKFEEMLTDLFPKMRNLFV